MKEETMHILEEGIMSSKRYCDNYTGLAVQRSSRRLEPIYSGLCEILKQMGKINVSSEFDSRKDVKFIYKGGVYKSLQEQFIAKTSYATDIVFNNVNDDNGVVRACEVRFPQFNIAKNVLNNGRDIMSRRSDFNDIISRRIGVMNQDYFNYVCLLNCEEQYSRDVRKTVIQTLTCRERGLKAAIIPFVFVDGKAKIKEDIIPDCLKLENSVFI